MRRYLVVAHKTLGGAHLFEHLHELREDDPFCRFHLIVPQHQPHDRRWTESEVRTEARNKLDEILETMAAMGMGATGEIGDADPVYAIGVALRREGDDAFAGIVLSTLPHGISRWWLFDVPRRVAKTYPAVPLTHVVAKEAAVG